MQQSLQKQKSLQRDRAALFSGRVGSPRNTRTNIASLPPMVRPENAEKALNEAIFQEQQARTAEFVVAEQSKIQRATDAILRDTQTIKAQTTETLTLSRQMSRGIQEIKRMLTTPGGAASLLMNPFFSLVVFFLAHPYLPVSVETVMPVWSVLLSGVYLYRTSVRLAKGETVLELGGRGGGVLGTVRSLVFSAPHAIILMYKLGTLWTEERTGTRGFSSANAAAFQQTTAASDWEPFLMEQFAKGMEALRSMNLQAMREASLPQIHLPAVSLDEWRAYLEGAGDRVYAEVQALDPELFKDKAGCIQLILQYVGGKLAVRAQGVAVATLNAPAYLHQARTVLVAEQWILQCLAHLLNDICRHVFRELWASTTQSICAALCAYESVMPPNPVESMGVGVGGGLTDWLGSPTSAYDTLAEKITAGTAAATEYLLRTTLVKTITEFDYVGTLLRQIARWTCDCRKYGVPVGKVKIDGGARTRRGSRSTKSRGKSRRRSIVKVRGRVPTDHAAFLRLSMRYVLFTLAPVLTGIPVFPTPASSLALDQAMRELLAKKVETGQFVPPLILTDVGIRDYFLEY